MGVVVYIPHLQYEPDAGEIFGRVRVLSYGARGHVEGADEQEGPHEDLRWGKGRWWWWWGCGRGHRGGTVER
jgi:hypothetical protein